MVDVVQEVMVDVISENQVLFHELPIIFDVSICQGVEHVFHLG